MNHIYKLNLSSIQDRLNISLEELIKDYDINLNQDKKNHVIYRRVHIDQYLLSSYLNWENINWKFIHLIFRNDQIGTIHSDNHAWCINWIESGNSLFDFWDSKHCIHTETTHDKLNMKLKRYKTNELPDGSYYAEKGAYLFNSAIPHRASGFNNRLLFTMIPDTDLSWNDAVLKFNKYFLKE